MKRSEEHVRYCREDEEARLRWYGHIINKKR
jgi:hypothetical protein